VDARTKQFVSGYLTHDRALSVYEDAVGLCVSGGAPRFADATHAAVALESGDAAAWLAAFRADGSAALDRVHGRFAVVIIEPAERAITLATDRFATWPLCYAEHPEGLCFADRADEVPGHNRRVCPQSVFDYLFFHVIPAPATILDGVQRLCAGHVLRWQDGKSELIRYWQPRFNERGSTDVDAASREFLRLVEQSVAREAAGRRAGAFLSGGTDSSTVAGMLCKVQGAPAETYSIGFDAPGYDEMTYARIASRHFGTRHHDYYVTPADLVTAIPRVAAHYDQPFGNSSAVPALICAERAAGDGVEKMLAGDGGDELFGGNTRYAKQRVLGWYGDLPGPLRGLMRLATLPGLRHAPVSKKVASYVDQASVPLPDRLQTYNLLLRTGVEAVLLPDFLAAVQTDRPLEMQRVWWHSVRARSDINRMLALDWKITLADSDLPKVIGATQLAGVDVGFPLLADELVEFSLGLPPSWKLRRLTLRWFFKHALRDFLPEEVIRKKKHGFGLPFGIWALEHPPLGAFVKEALHTIGERRIIQPAFLERLLREHLPAHPSYYGELVWVLMMLELWLRESHAEL
jgi:asparagine synthase (glutamine-hydrolysing)